MRRFRRGRRTSWGYSTTNLVSVTATEGNPSGAGIWIVPPRWVNWNLEQRRQTKMLWCGCQMWLDWTITNVSTNGQNMQPVVFAMQKVKLQPGGSDTVPDAELAASPFAEPELPTGVLSWDEESSPEGTRPLCWRHIIPPSTAPQSFFGGAPGSMSGSSTVGYADGFKQHVLMAWQPSVRVRVKRRLQRDEGIRLSFALVGVNPNGLEYSLGLGCNSLFR